jgi:hypothetical protein
MLNGDRNLTFKPNTYLLIGDGVDAVLVTVNGREEDESPSVFILGTKWRTKR